MRNFSELLYYLIKMKNSDKIIYQKGKKKGIWTGHSETVIKSKRGTYDTSLQQINDRILSYRPNVDKEHIEEWDGKTWVYGQYLTMEKEEPSDTPDSLLFKDMKLLTKSAACMRGYNHPSRVRGGTYQDVDDFFNFVTIKLLERRLKQYDPDSVCRELDNWPSYIARVIPQYLIAYNKSKFDFQIEAYWPLIKDDKTGTLQPKDFGQLPKLPTQFLKEKSFMDHLNKIVESIPEALGYQSDILICILFGITFTNRRLVQQIAEIVKMQIYESEVELA